MPCTLHQQTKLKKNDTCPFKLPQKDASFSKSKNIPDQLSDDREGNIIQNIDFSYFSNGASFMGHPVDPEKTDLLSITSSPDL